MRLELETIRATLAREWLDMLDLEPPAMTEAALLSAHQRCRELEAAALGAYNALWASSLHIAGFMDENGEAENGDLRQALSNLAYDYGRAAGDFERDIGVRRAE